MKWNEYQEQAISTCYINPEKTKRCNLLVNAAAGSGKTAVLVERIIRKIENVGGIDIDKLLVVTFTRAAAAEMQQKIHRAIVKRLENLQLSEEEKAHLVRQLRLLPGADICNIDSYCIRVVRNNFHLLGVDPNFSPASGGEIEIMKDEAIDLLFEELYESQGEEKFLSLVEKFSNTGDDRGLAEMIKKLQNFTTSLPEPEKWLSEAVEKLSELSVEEFAAAYIKSAEEQVDAIIRTAAANVIGVCAETAENSPLPIETEEEYRVADLHTASLEKLVYTANHMVNTYPVGDENPVYLRWGNLWKAVASDFEMIFPMYGAGWESAVALAGAKLENFPSSTATLKFTGFKNNEYGSDNEEALLEFRKNHTILSETLKSLCEYSLEVLKRELEMAKQYTLEDTRELCRITILYNKKLEILKQRRGVLEFSDIERLVYKLLAENPSIKKEYNEKYHEVLIDEYQDINALQDALFGQISNGDNLFMVGDMKQSIYRFRNSDPTIFKTKNEIYSNGDENNKVINLNRNYRSRENVLASINNVFSVIMSEDAGEIDYDYTQWLYAGDTEYEEVNGSFEGENMSELVFIQKETENEENGKISEAKYVARRIRSMIDNGFKVRRAVEDDKGNRSFVYENAAPRDFVILAGSVKNIAGIYEEALEAEGLLSYIETEGYFDKQEIMAVMSMVKMIDNPLNDIPFTASMRHPVCGFTDDELAQIRLAGNGSMYECTVKMSGVYSGLGLKCKKFIDMLKNWRFYSRIMPCDKLLMTICEQTDLYSYYGTFPNGEQLQANLRILFSRAREFEKSGYKGLFNFVRYVDKMKESANDLSPAKLISEEHDVVRMMTMHKSKGLEFPIVFVVNSTKKFKALRTEVLNYHKDKGIALKYVNEEQRFSIPTLLTKEIIKKNHIENIAENMRLLYVALTRAKEKLIVTGSEPQTLKKLKFYESGNASVVNTANSFYEWLEPIAQESELWYYKSITPPEAKADETDETDKVSVTEISDKSDIFNWSYKYVKSTQNPAKISVTELKRRKILMDIMDSDTGSEFKKASIRKRPFFMQENEPLTNAQKGTVVHYIMQTLPDYADMETIENHMQDLVEKGRLTQKECDSVDKEKILAYYSTDISKRIQASPKVYKEVPFEIAESTANVYGFEGDEVIIQGIIDCCFEENGEIVLLDYKTDYYKEGDGHTLAEKYKIQLDNYAHAIEKITKKRVKEKYLYLFFHNDVVECI